MCINTPLLISLQPGGSPYHTIHLADTTLEGWNFQNLKQHRSNSWSESLDDLKIIQDSFGDSAKTIKYAVAIRRTRCSSNTLKRKKNEKKMQGPSQTKRALLVSGPLLNAQFLNFFICFCLVSRVCAFCKSA